MFTRVFAMFILIWLMIFIFARMSTRKSENKSTEKEQSRVVDEPESEETEADPFKTAKEHLRSISSSLYKVCNMDIRNAGMRVHRIAKDIVQEKYVEKNECRGYSQFERYYLPTLRRTVDNYSKIEQKGITDMKVRSDMLEYLQSCEDAFSRLYSSMFDKDIMDMEVRMEAMNITMKRDGLL